MIEARQRLGQRLGHDRRALANEAPQHALHLLLDLGAQLVELAVLDEVGDVVVGVVAAAGADQPVADAIGRRQARQVAFAAKDRGGLLAGHGQGLFAVGPGAYRIDFGSIGGRRLVA